MNIGLFHIYRAIQRALYKLSFVKGPANVRMNIELFMYSYSVNVNVGRLQGPYTERAF